ncbi:protein FAM228A isoform X2 [Heptranchias perlo]|uniref:protein FAM228A isoform X2 n=1 Tax=Heptranchias perlo TaxID=212740 RepID=UPI00355982B1
MSLKRIEASGNITVHAPFQIECTEAVATARTCPMKSLSAQRCARIEQAEKSLSASVCSTEQNCVDWLSKKSFAHLQAKADMESREIYALCRPMYDTEECFIKELDKYLAYKDMLNLRKKELLYKKWTECVYEPLQWKVKAISNQSIERRRASILQYLDYCNKKEPVFLEEYNPDDYNPFVLHLCKPRRFKTRTSTLNDPLLLQSRSKSEEDSAILQCQKGKVYSLKETEEFHQAQLPLLPLGRHNIDPIGWLRIPIGYIESEVRQRSRKRMIWKTWKI